MTVTGTSAMLFGENCIQHNVCECNKYILNQQIAEQLWVKGHKTKQTNYSWVPILRVLINYIDNYMYLDSYHNSNGNVRRCYRHFSNVSKRRFKYVSFVRKAIWEHREEQCDGCVVARGVGLTWEEMETSVCNTLQDLTVGELMVRDRGEAQWHSWPYPSYREQKAFLLIFSGVTGQSHSIAVCVHVCVCVCECVCVWVCGYE